MADVFISYSRKDSEFVQRIHGGLVKRNRDIWIDWEDIPLTSNWWREICEGIEGAETFIFVMSPDSVASPICNFEIAHAVQYNKRIVPIVRREVNEAETFARLERVKLPEGAREILVDRDLLAVGRQSWAVLARHNWIFFEDDSAFDTTFDKLLNTLDTDLTHVKLHTRLLVRALDWERSKRNPSFVLLGDEIVGAENWLHEADVQFNSPVPTRLHRTYIAASRQTENARQQLLRNLRGASVIAGIIGVAAVIATVVAVLGAQAASNSAATAQAQAEDAQHIIGTSTSVFGTQVVDVRQAQAAVANANATLSPIPPTLTQAADSINAAGTEVEQAQQDIVDANATLDTVATEVQRQRDTADSLRLAALAEHIYNEDDMILGLSLALEANRVESPPGEVQTTLMNLADAPGPRRQFTGHLDIINAMAFSPDGQFIVSGSCGENTEQGGFNVCTVGEIILWDAATAQAVRTFTGHIDAVNTVAFSPDGQSIVSGSCAEQDEARYCIQGEIILWDATTGQAIRTFSGHTDKVNAVAYSPDGQFIVSGSEDNTHILWDVATGEAVRTFTGHTSSVNPVAFSPDGQFIVSASEDKTLMLWDVSSGQAVRTFRGHEWFFFTSVAFSPDGQSIASGTCNPCQCTMHSSVNSL